MAQKRLEKSREPLCFSKTVVPAEEAFEPDQLWSSAPARTPTGRPSRAISASVGLGVLARRDALDEIQLDQAHRLRSRTSSIRSAASRRSWGTNVRVGVQGHANLRVAERSTGLQAWTVSETPE